MTKLAEAILDRRVQSPNYFQGRIAHRLGPHGRA